MASTKNINQEIYSTDEDFANLFAESIKNEKKEGTVVVGTVMAIDKDFVIVDIGVKNEGYIPIKEFTHGGAELTVNIGDSVDVYLDKIESRTGKTILSRDKAIKEELWGDLEKLQNSNKTVEGVIICKVKGGFAVELMGGINAFLPGSQVDIRPVKDKDILPLMNIKQPFIILKSDREQGNLVVSRRAIMEESRVEARNELLSQIVEGQVMEGVVKNITDYGAFIDLGSVDGLLHVTDISWGRISNPAEVLTLGQHVKVQVIKYNQETKRISLGMKQLESNPWSGIETRYPKDIKFKGKVTNITDYGAFIELEPGIEGLVHVSEISWVKNNVHPRKLLNPNQEVEFMVLDIDASKHRISLGMKQCIDNPWARFAQQYPVNSIVEGTIKNVVDFGLFVGFSDDIDGLVHLSDISWNESEDAAEKLSKFKKDDVIKLMVLAVDPEKERISLGIKQLEGEETISLKKGDTVTCTVIAVKEDGIEVKVGDTSIVTHIKKSDLAKDRSEQKADRFAVDELVDAKITNFDKSTRKISLSIKALEVEEQNEMINKHGSTDSGASLGNIFGAAFKQSTKK